MEFGREEAGRGMLYTWLYHSFHRHYLADGLNGFWKMLIGRPTCTLPCPFARFMGGKIALDVCLLLSHSCRSFSTSWSTRYLLVWFYHHNVVIASTGHHCTLYEGRHGTPLPWC